MRSLGVASIIALALGGAAVEAAPLERADASQWRLVGAGVSTMPMWAAAKPKGFIAGGHAGTRPFRKWLPQSERRKLSRIRYLHGWVLLAAFVRAERGSRVVLERVQRQRETVHADVGVAEPKARARVAVLYRLFIVPFDDIFYDSDYTPVRFLDVTARPRFPPPAYLGQIRMAVGSGCWNDGRRSECWDTLQPTDRDDLPVSKPHQLTRLHFRLAFPPASATATFVRRDRIERFDLAPTNPLVWTVPVDFRYHFGDGYLTISVVALPRVEGTGHLDYVIHLQIPPA
jgi:hypothetical protein